MTMLRKMAALLVCAGLMIPLGAKAAGQPMEEGQPLLLTSPSAVLAEPSTGAVIFEKNADERREAASITKLMTALLVLEAVEQGQVALTDSVTISQNAAAMKGSQALLDAGATYSLEDLLMTTIMASANDSAVALAEHLCGTEALFAEKMNERADALGLDAHFVTPNGLDAQGHGASALAMCRLAAKALENEDFRRIVAMQSATVPWEGNEYDRVLTNKNKLLKECEGATGVKTGYTSRAGRCLVFSAERDGMELVGAVLNCYTWFDSAEKLLDAGFAQYEMKTVLEKGETAGEIGVSGGTQKSVRVSAQRELRAPTAQHEALEMRLELPGEITAPVAAGQELGTAYLTTKDGAVIARCPLVAQEDVPRNTVVQALRRIFGQWRLLAG